MRGVSGVRVPAGVYVSGQAAGWPGIVAMQGCLQAHIESLRPGYHGLFLARGFFLLVGRHSGIPKFQVYQSFRDTKVSGNIKVLLISKFYQYKRFSSAKVFPIPKFYPYQSFPNARDVFQYQRGLAMSRELLKQTQIDVIIMHTNREGPICVLGKCSDLLT